MPDLLLVAAVWAVWTALVLLEGIIWGQYRYRQGVEYGKRLGKLAAYRRWGQKPIDSERKMDDRGAAC